MADPKPVIATAPCDQAGCTETMTLHEVKRGGSQHRGQIYTRCPSCGCNQTTGKLRQQWLIENATPRPGYGELFEFKKKAGDDTVSDGIKPDPDNAISDEELKEAIKNTVSDKKSPGVALGILGFMVVGGLALLGLKK